MYHLYAYKDGEWKRFAQFSSKYDYIASVKSAIATKKATGKTTSEQNAARVMEYFVLNGYAFDEKRGKLVMRALRYFDEVGISNDLHAALEELLDDGATAFAFATADDEQVSQRPLYAFDFVI